MTTTGDVSYVRADDLLADPFARRARRSAGWAVAGT